MVGHKRNIETLATDFQTFLGIKLSGNEIKESAESLRQLGKQGAFDQYGVKMEEDETIEGRIFEVTRFGNIRVNMKKTEFTPYTDAATHLQIQVDK